MARQIVKIGCLLHLHDELYSLQLSLIPVLALLVLVESINYQSDCHSVY